MKPWILPISLVCAVGLTFGIGKFFDSTIKPKELKIYMALCGDKQYKFQAVSWDNNLGQCTRFYGLDNQVSSFVCHCYMISEIKEEGKK